MSNPYAADYTNEYDEGAGVPQQPIAPVEERYEGWNAPYRGNVTHGVNPELFAPDLPDESWEGAEVEIKEAQPEPIPVPVRIVDESPGFISDWRTGQLSVNLNASVLVGANPNRTSLRLRNLSANKAIYVGRNTVTYLSGFPIPPASEFTITSTGDVWAVCTALEDTTSAPILVAILEEFTVEVK